MPAFTPRNIALGVGAVGVLAFAFPRSTSKIAPDNVFETPAVKNVGSRYAAQGGSNTHLPGIATPLGNSENTISNQEKPTGISTGHFEKNHADQKVNGPISGAGAKFVQAQYGNDKGK